MELEARGNLNNNSLRNLENGSEANGKLTQAKDVELPLITRNGGGDLEKGRAPEPNYSLKADHEHGHAEANELVEGHGIQPDHATT